MTTLAGSMALALIVLLPVALSIASIWRRARSVLFDLLPLVPVPALAVALLGIRGEMAQLPELLLGIRLVLDETGAVFLGFISLLWVLAGAYARAYLPGRTRDTAFPGFWYATLAGNLGVCIAADVVTFYALFSLLSLAAYGLVVHDGTTRAFRAGRVYLVLAVIGEMGLVFGLMLAAQAAGGLEIDAARAALANAPQRDLTIALLVVGFGVKAGLVPLHVWLPLAHPIAPTPASAVLSGAIVKAGILGLMRFLPLEAILLDWGHVLAFAGLVTAYYGVLIGLTQTDPKAILAYSTLSQMGIVVAVLGAALALRPDDTLDAAALYATNHGLAKGALFLSVGVVAASGRLHWSVMLPTAVAAGAIAGLPLTGGALAKLAIKGSVGSGVISDLVSWSAVGTTLLLLRFLYVLAANGDDDRARRPASGLVWPWAAAVLAALVLPWALFLTRTSQPIAEALDLGNLWSGAWPVALGMVIAVAAMTYPRRVLPAIPEGDIVVPLEAGLRRLRVLARIELRAASRWQPRSVLTNTRNAAGRLLDRSESLLLRWSFGGAALLAIVILFGAALAG